MCGIVGLYGEKITFAHEKMFKDLLRMDTIRGAHSTGVYVVAGKDLLWNYLKDECDGYEFASSGAYSAWTSGIKDMKAMVGHNRYATTGAINVANAHPFEHDGVVLVHNGSLETRYRHPKHFEVDSESICYWLSTEAKATTVLQELEGAFSLVWYNMNNKTLNLARNDQRPMYIAELEDGVVVLGSEPGMIRWAVERAKLKIKDNRVQATSKLTHYTINLEADRFGKTSLTTFTEPETYWNYKGGNVSPKYQGSTPSGVTYGSYGGNVYYTNDQKRILAYENAGGYRQGDMVDFMIYDFVPYNTVDALKANASGKWIGFSVDNAQAGKIRVAGRKDEKYDPGTVYTGKVSYTTFYEAEANAPTVVIDVLSVKECETDYDDEDSMHVETYDMLGYHLTAEEYDYECNNLGGCSDCTKPLDHKEADHHHWMDVSTVICKECMSARLDSSTKSVIYQGVDYGD